MTFLTVARQQIAMQRAMQRRPKTMNPQPASSHLRRQGFLETLALGLTLFVVPAILCGEILLAQTNSPQPTKSTQQQKAAAKSVQSGLPAPETIASPPPASPSHIWPANQPPKQATVSWDGRGLEIEAANSSLNQILHQVAAATGAKLEGHIQDQRVFGNYGPGPERDVLSKLLDGSGYNVLIIGGREADAPLEIVLSARSSASPQTAANNQNRRTKDDEAGKQLESRLQPDYPPEPPRSQPVQNPFGNGEPPRDSQEFMQEILQRQQKIDEQQQQQLDQQNNPR